MSQISRYSFITCLIKDDIEHETVDSSVVISSGPSEYPRAEFFFMVDFQSIHLLMSNLSFLL